MKPSPNSVLLINIPPALQEEIGGHLSRFIEVLPPELNLAELTLTSVSSKSPGSLKECRSAKAVVLYFESDLNTELVEKCTNLVSGASLFVVAKNFSHSDIWQLRELRVTCLFKEPLPVELLAAQLIWTLGCDPDFMTLIDQVRELTLKEYRIVKAMCKGSGHKISREALKNAVWPGISVGDKTIDVHIFNARQKLRAAGFDISSDLHDGFLKLSRLNSQPDV